MRARQAAPCSVRHTPSRAAPLPSPRPLPRAVYAARNGLLYTLNCQSAEARWAANEEGFRRAAETFAILNAGVATAGFPDSL